MHLNSTQVIQDALVFNYRIQYDRHLCSILLRSWDERCQKRICTYHIGLGLQGILFNVVFICNGVSEAASMIMDALVGTGERSCFFYSVIHCGVITHICLEGNQFSIDVIPRTIGI